MDWNESLDIDVHVASAGPAGGFELYKRLWFDVALGLGIGFGTMVHLHEHKDTPAQNETDANESITETGFAMFIWPSFEIGLRLARILKVSVLAHVTIATGFQDGYVIAPGGAINLLFGVWAPPRKKK